MSGMVWPRPQLSPEACGESQTPLGFKASLERGSHWTLAPEVSLVRPSAALYGNDLLTLPKDHKSQLLYGALLKGNCTAKLGEVKLEPSAKSV